MNEEQIENLVNTDFDKFQLVINRIYKEEYVKRLEHNWNELKKWLEELQQEEFDINGFTGVCTEIRLDCILDKMSELERGEE